MENRTLAEKLKELRILHNCNQADVAAVLGIVRQTYSHYETGKRKPSYSALAKLANFYGVSMEVFSDTSIKTESSLTFHSSMSTQTEEEFGEYLAYFNTDANKRKFQFHSVLEKQLLYYFEKLSEADKKELIEIAKIKNK